MNYVIRGRVIRGDGYGRKLGFPTVNLDSYGVDLPKAGVYSGSALLENKSYRAGIVIGTKETKSKVEAHLIDYTGDAYGKEVTLEVEKFIREYKNFRNEEELIKQIKADLVLCSQE